MIKTGSLLDRILQALYPSNLKCIVCGCELDQTCRGDICQSCYNNLLKSGEKVCEKCGETLDSLAKYCLNCKKSVTKSFLVARAPFLYDGDIVKLIHELKYDSKAYIGEYLSEFLVDEYLKDKFNADFVVPIPLNPKREKQRGYNQALMLCKAFSTELNMQVDSTNLIRVVDTPTQTALNKEERMHNLEHAFCIVDKKLFKGKNILLIDDVYTTGATMDEASKTLIKSGGANAVYCLSVAHTLPPHLRKKEDSNL